MNIIERMLSMVNEKDLGNIIRFYTDEEYYEVELSEHLRAWAKNKEHIFELFGNKLTIEKEVETQLPPTVVKDKLIKFFDTDFKESKYNIIKTFLLNLSMEEISVNVLKRDFQLFDEKFKRGMKVSKCFRRLIKKEWLDTANIKYSMFVQSLKAKGTAVLSIDPKDYVTMSANNSGWRSCHAPDGEYRVGEIAYMMDNSSIISYVKATDDCLIYDETIHANKIWRQIVLVNPGSEYGMQCRQYPNNNEANALTVGDLLIKAFEEKQGIKYTSTKSEVETRIFGDLQMSHSYEAMYYNDVEHASFDEGYVVHAAEVSLEELYNLVNSKVIDKIIVGHDVRCLCGCGSYIENPEHFFIENSGYYDDEYDEY